MYMILNTKPNIMNEHHTMLAQQFLELQKQVAAQGNILAQQAAQIRALQRGSKKHEAYFQQLLEKKLCAKRLHIEGVGTTDLTTADAHVEIKRWTRYHEVPGQLAKYQQGCPRNNSVVYFFGMPPSLNRLEQIINLMTAHGIQMYSIDDDDKLSEHTSPLDTVAVADASAAEIDAWTRKNATHCPGARVHVHRFTKAYEHWTVETKQKNKKIPTARVFIESLQKMGYKVSPYNTNSRDSKCCDSICRFVTGVDVIVQ